LFSAQHLAPGVGEPPLVFIISSSFVKVSRTPVPKYDRFEGHHTGGTLLQEFTNWVDQEDFVRILLEFGADPNFTANPDSDSTPIQNAFTNLKTLNVFAELNKIPSDMKVEYIETVFKYGDDETISLEGFKTQLSSLSVTELAEETTKFGHEVYRANQWTEGKLLQVLATKTSEVYLGLLQLLLDHGLDPLAVSEGVPYSALEIAASFGKTTEAFNKLAAHTEESHKKSVCQLLRWACNENKPSDKFKELLCTIPAAEVERLTIQKSSLLQYVASHGKTPYVTILLQHGVDPEAVTGEDSDTALYCAWKNDHIATMGVLAEVAEPSLEMRTSKTWALVEKDQERRWQREVVAKLDKLAIVINMVAMKVGIDADDLIFS